MKLDTLTFTLILFLMNYLKDVAELERVKGVTTQIRLKITGMAYLKA